MPGFVHVQTCYPYRYQGAKPGETVGQAAARELEEAILREGPDTVAAFVGEPIHGAGGVFYPTDDYWPRVREICTRHDVLLIADEIITGFCRTGRWFGLSHWNVTPDILSFAKGVTSGYLPLGGMMVTGAIKDAMDCVTPQDRWMHAYTYSGHPACCAVALKNIEIMERERLWENAAAMGERLQAGLDGGVRRSAEHRRHPRRQGAARGGGVRRGSGDEGRTSRADLKFAASLKAEMMKRGVITRTRPAAGAASRAGRHPVLRAAARGHRGGDRPVGRGGARRRPGRACADVGGAARRDQVASTRLRNDVG